jgi:hypothetical protein
MISGMIAHLCALDVDVAYAGEYTFTSNKCAILLK